MTRAATPFVNAEITTVADAGDDKSPIEERQQTRAALRESEDRLHSIMQSAMDAMITVDEKLRIVKFNAAAEKMFDCPAHQARDGPLNRFIPQRFHAVHPGSYPSLRRVRQSGMLRVQTSGHLWPEGERRRVSSCGLDLASRKQQRKTSHCDSPRHCGAQTGRACPALVCT